MDFSKLDMEVRDPNNVNDHLKVKKSIISVFDCSISTFIFTLPIFRPKLGTGGH